MGWISYARDGEILREETHARPVQAGEEGDLLAIAQEDFGHKVAVDLTGGIIFIDYETIGVQNGTLEIASFKTMLYICDETNIGAFIQHHERRVEDLIEDGKKVYEKDETGQYKKDPYGFRIPVKVRTDYFKPLLWRPIWFTRYTNGNPTKIIGAQTTFPEEMNSKNVKKMVSLFSNGMLGID